MLRRSLYQRHSLFGASASLSCCRRQCSSSQSPNSPSVEHLEDSEASPTPPSAAISIERSGLYNPPRTFFLFQFRGGPISVAEYMEEVLTNPKAGFYINHDVFGAEGDFVISVSQMFGEMVGVWAMCLWEKMGQPKKLNLVELGPGRGTLLADLLRGASKFRNFTGSLHIHMVECSPTLQKPQYQNLKCINKETDGDAEEHIISRLTGTRVSWHTTLEQVSTGSWCEKTVDVAENSMFQFVLSKQPTPATLYLLKRFKWAENEEISKLEQVEVCPKAMDLTQEIAQRIGSEGGYGFVNILDNPGTADLCAAVDFAAIRHSAEEASDDVAVHGPMTQSQFPGSLGINFQVEALMEKCTDEQVGEGEAPLWECPEEQAPIGMGTRYLTMAIVNKKQGVPVPFR
ncbi:unnamed protein product [Withania somnifera]